MQFRLDLAERLGRTLGELEASLDNGEYLLWVARERLRVERQQKERAQGR